MANEGIETQAETTAIEYTPTVWRDGEDGGTPINAANLNNIEEAITAIVERVSKQVVGSMIADGTISKGKLDSDLQTEINKKVGMAKEVTNASVSQTVQGFPAINIGAKNTAETVQKTLAITPTGIYSYNGLTSKTEWSLDATLLSAIRYGRTEQSISMIEAWWNHWIYPIVLDLSSAALGNTNYKLLITVESARAGAVYSSTVARKTETSATVYICCPYQVKDDYVRVNWIAIKA